MMDKQAARKFFAGPYWKREPYHAMTSAARKLYRDETLPRV